MNEDIDKLFESHDIRPTAVRLLVWKTLQKFNYAFALYDLENALPLTDRSSIFRALTLFAEKGLLHVINDGSGQHKYCIQQQHGCEHVHITCVKCGRTFCYKNQEIPPVEVPPGFEIYNISYVIQGVCSHCANKKIEGKVPDCCCHNT